MSVLLLITLFVPFVTPQGGSFPQFDDGVLFRLEWNGYKDAPDALLKEYDQNMLTPDKTMVMSTSNQEEKYVCSLPDAPLDDSDGSSQHYSGPTPGELFMPLYVSRSCSYRIEMYWSYELCHGRFIQQYHEEKDAVKGTKRQEYYLGQFMSEAVAQDDKSFDQMNPPKRKIDEQLLPYYPVKYVQGTVCDINSRPRTTTVMYVCQPGGRNQIYSLDEVASCDYEMVVLTDRLCTHPSFAPKKNVEYSIQCFPATATTPKAPTALTLWEKEQQWQLKQQYEHAFSSSSERLKQRDQQQQKKAPPSPSGDSSSVESSAVPAATKPVDNQLATAFLQGDYCLYGGSGWWKHEYCHGKQVIQFHEDQKTGRTEVLLGKWNEKSHLQWIHERPHKKPLEVDGRIRQVSHYYDNGEMCDLTGRPRQVEVRLRCRESKGDSNAVSIYILEPKTCEYILGVESAMFCDILQTANADGLLEHLQS